MEGGMGGVTPPISGLGIGLGGRDLGLDLNTDRGIQKGYRDGALGMGHWGWGIGDGALGVGNWGWGTERNLPPNRMSQVTHADGQ